MKLNINHSSCLDIHAHSCLKPFSITRRKTIFKQQIPCSNHEIHVPFEHGFGLKSVVIMSHRNKMADVEEVLRFSVSF